MLEYKKKFISSQSSLNKGGKIDVKIEVGFTGDLTEEDENEMCRLRDKISAICGRRWRMNDKEYQQEIKEERVKLLKCFPEPIYVKEIPNGYYSDLLNPWFLVTTRLGVIKIGWRSKVINIDWSDSDIKIKPDVLFATENVTKGDGWGGDGLYIHAYGYDKAKEYIHKLLNS